MIRPTRLETRLLAFLEVPHPPDAERLPGARLFPASPRYLALRRWGWAVRNFFGLLPIGAGAFGLWWTENRIGVPGELRGVLLLVECLLIGFWVSGALLSWWLIRLEALQNEPAAFGKSVEEHQATPVETIAARFRKTSERNFTLGAFEDDNLVGTATFVRDTDLKSRHKGHIYGVYVAAAHRRKGVGRALIQALIERAKQDPSLEQILLAVATIQSAARQLYRNCGFETYGTEPYALKVGDRYIDEDYMILRLRPRAFDG